jgi:hypothetical protein
MTHRKNNSLNPFNKFITEFQSADTLHFSTTKNNYHSSNIARINWLSLSIHIGKTYSTTIANIAKIVEKSQKYRD